MVLKENSIFAKSIITNNINCMSIHVIFSKGEWKVIKEDSTKALRVFSNRQSAIKYGKTVRRTKNADLYIHRMDGTISAKNMRTFK